MSVIVTSSFGAIAPAITTFTTWNPLDKCADTSLSNGDLTATCGVGSGNASVRTVNPVTTGQKKIWETTLDTNVGALGASAIIGYGTAGAGICNVVGSETSSVGYSTNGVVFSNFVSLANFATYDIGDTISIEYEESTSTATFYKNGVLQGSVSPSLTGGASIFPMVSNNEPNRIITFTSNFGATPFVITPQPGFTGISA